MKTDNIFMLSLVTATTLMGGEISLQNIVVEDERESAKEIEKSINISQKVDLSEVLNQNIPEITLVRTSGIGNDVILRGLQRDNLAVVIDDAIIYGACPNRMDPAIMHVSSAQVKDVEINEGVFDVTQFGSLGGSLKVETKEPQEGFGGEVSATYNSMGSKMFSTNLEGGNELLKVNGGFSYEEADQYRDGDGNSFSEQIDNIVLNDSIVGNEGVRYIDPDMSAFERKNWWLNFLITPSDQHKIKLGYFGDKATDVLYPIFGMDAVNDETQLFTFKYEGYNLSDFSEKLKVHYFHSDVDHDMSTRYRMMSILLGGKTHSIESIVDGVKVENRFSRGDYKLLLGVDAMKKSWDGTLFDDNTGSALYTMIPDVETQDLALYGTVTHIAENYDLTFGFRADQVQIDANSLDAIHMKAKSLYAGKDSRDFSSLSLNLSGRYYVGDDSSIFAGVGQSARVPNGKELYMNKFDMNKMVLSIEGNPDLEQTINREIDLGFDSKVLDGDFKFKTFYSQLENFIYAYNNGNGLGFKNIDATIYGFDARYSKNLSSSLKTDIGVAYQRGEKDEAIDGQTDKDLAEIPPLKFIGNLEYFRDLYSVRVEVIGADDQITDEDNGEKDISGYMVANIKGNYKFSKALTVNVGVDNIFDKTYTLNNSYIGRGVNSTSPESIFVLNEMGRNFFINLNYKF